MYPKVLFLAALLTGALGQLKLQGTCDQHIKGVEDFEIAKLKHGVWYALEGLGEGVGSTCPALRITGTKDNELDYYRMFVEDTEAGKDIPYQVHETTKSPGKGIVTFMSNLFTMVDTENVPYLVLNTDHESFALIYHCRQDSADTKTVNAWKLSTTKTLTPEQDVKLKECINRHPELRTVTWKAYDQSKCDLFTV